MTLKTSCQMGDQVVLEETPRFPKTKSWGWLCRGDRLIPRKGEKMIQAESTLLSADNTGAKLLMLH